MFVIPLYGWGLSECGWICQRSVVQVVCSYKVTALAEWGFLFMPRTGFARRQMKLFMYEANLFWISVIKSYNLGHSFRTNMQITKKGKMKIMDTTLKL